MINLDDTNFKFTVVGGGTAGWLTALYLRMVYPNPMITVIESKEIGILGAGEGSTPQLVEMFNELNIPITDFTKYARGTFKNGIKFTNWNGDNTHYYHGFGHVNDLTVRRNLYTKIPISLLELIGNGQNLDELDITALASERNAVKFLINSLLDNKSQNPIKHFSNIGGHSVHFNAVMLAEHLKNVGRKRNIKIIEDTVQKVNTDNEGNIISLKLEFHEKVDTDFVFDCTGFRHLFIGNHYKSEWKSYKDYLPANRALAFTIPISENDPNLPPYTEAIAMKYGWTWKIPVQDRFGCGYVFDSRRITDDDAKEEIDEMTGIDTDIPRAFSYEPGSYNNTWIKNCVAIGLSSGFIEPLEATSIWATILNLRNFFFCSKGLTCKDQNQIDHFNKQGCVIAESILRFVQFHYLTKRKDTIFWKNFAEEYKICDYTQWLISKNRDVGMLTEDSFPDTLFPQSSWLSVGAGIKFFNQEEAKKLYLTYNTGSRKGFNINNQQQFLLNLSLTTAGLVDHKFFIDYLITEGVKF